MQRDLISIARAALFIHSHLTENRQSIQSLTVGFPQASTCPWGIPRTIQCQAEYSKKNPLRTGISSGA